MNSLDSGVNRISKSLSSRPQHFLPNHDKGLKNCGRIQTHTHTLCLLMHIEHIPLSLRRLISSVGFGVLFFASKKLSNAIFFLVCMCSFCVFVFPPKIQIKKIHRSRKVNEHQGDVYAPTTCMLCVSVCRFVSVFVRSHICDRHTQLVLCFDCG